MHTQGDSDHEEALFGQSIQIGEVFDDGDAVPEQFFVVGLGRLIALLDAGAIDPQASDALLLHQPIGRLRH